jgi:hypothetical protein
VQGDGALMVTLFTSESAGAFVSIASFLQAVINNVANSEMKIICLIKNGLIVNGFFKSSVFFCSQLMFFGVKNLPVQRLR